MGEWNWWLPGSFARLLRVRPSAGPYAQPAFESD
jgi:hypothetical protein